MDLKPVEIFKQPVVRENIAVLDSTLPKNANVRAVRFTGSGTVLGHSLFPCVSNPVRVRRRKTIAVPFRGFVRAFNYVVSAAVVGLVVLPIFSHTNDESDLNLTVWNTETPLVNFKPELPDTLPGMSALIGGSIFGCACNFLVHDSPGFLGCLVYNPGVNVTVEFWFDYLQVY